MGTRKEALRLMPTTKLNKYRAAIDVLQRGRDMLVAELAETVLDQADDLMDGGYLLNEFLENHGTRLHFLGLLVSQLEQSAEALDEAEAKTPPPPQTPPKRRRTRSRSPKGKKLQRQSSPEGSPDDV